MNRLLGPFARPPRQWGDRQLWPAVVALAATIHLLVFHPEWVRGGDAEVFLSVARGLADGGGYRYNGQPVALVPPGWPAALAVALRVTDLVGALKLLTLASTIGFVAVSYPVLRRLADPWPAAAACALTAVLHPLTELTHTFFSDPPFALLAMGSLWLALLRNPAAPAGSVAALVAASTLRWAGLLWAPAVAVALWISGRRAWAVVALVAGAATFAAQRYALRVDPADLDPRYPTFIATGYDVEEPGAIDPRRLALLPRWTGDLLWFRLSRKGPVQLAAWALAAGAVVCVGVTLYRDGWRKRRWLWLAPLAYLLPIVLRWPHPVARYWLPIAPFLILAIVLCADDPRRPLRWTARAALALALLYNGGTLVLETRAARSPLVHHEGGTSAQLAAIAEWLRTNGVEGDVAADASWRFEGGHARSSFGPRRVLEFALGRPVVEGPPDHEVNQPPGPPPASWAGDRGVRWFLAAPVWPKLVQVHAARLRHGWGLWHLGDDGGWRRVDVGPPRLVHRVPRRLMLDDEHLAEGDVRVPL